GEMKIYCPVCNWVVVSLPALEDHMKQHRGRTESVLYQCPHCPYSTDKAATLIGHQRSHADEMLHKCWVCDEVFANSEDYCSHQTTHINRARRRKSIGQPPGDVSPDKRIHAGERPYHCNVCGVDFTQSQHLRTHAGGRPFTRGKASSEAGGLRACRQARAGSSASTPPARPLRRCARGRAGLLEGVTAA
uniref:C2H2-type domain-containing protein n=1 Tax=Petromyzon marinus TaxID=7757 RepID=S4RU30_PETMA